MAPGDRNSRLESSIDRALSVQRVLVVAHIQRMRAKRPNASPAEIITALERRYLAATTTGGAAVGASSAIPGVGLGVALGLSAVETAGFLEASALFAQSVAEVHGITVDDPDRARTLVMTLMLGTAGQDLVRQLVTSAATGSAPQRSAFWGEVVTRNLPSPVVRALADRVARTFVRRFAARQSTSVVTRLVPFGIGAVLGGVGTHLLARRVVDASRTAFPPPPAHFPDQVPMLTASPHRAALEQAAPRAIEVGTGTPRAIEAPQP